MKLLPNKNIEQIIEVEPREKLVNIKPYRYPHHHKIENGSLTQDLLRCGVILKSRSPYGSPIVLVRKNDRYFRLCIYYRWISKIIIKNKFPIPFIDEMLDELHGAKYFSKVDFIIKDSNHG